MIDRYTRPELAAIWSEENKYTTWLNVELALVETLSELNRIPKESLNVIKQKAKFNIQRIHEIDKEVHHDVIAFLTCLTESIGSEGRFLHSGMTSSDLIDTSTALLLKQAGEVILDEIDTFLKTLKAKAIEHKNSICIGRSHGVHAEPTTFGLKLLLFWEELSRAKLRFKSAVEEISVGMFSGAVGTYSNIDPKTESLTNKKLGLKTAPVSTQIISRDRHASYISELAIIATIIEQIATEIRHLQRTEVLEVEEPFYSNQKGSSAMPHKRNPWRSENLCGLARLVRSYSIACMENIPLWHERDISHSSVERVVFPDATTTVDFMLCRINEIITNLNVYPENMRENLLKFGGVTFSQSVLMKLIEKGLEREIAYKLVQKNAHTVWNKKGGDFKKTLLSDKEILKYLNEKEINEIFQPEQYLKQIDTVFNRVLEERAVACKA